MKKRLLLYAILILLVGLLGYFGVTVYVAHSSNLNFAKDSVKETTQVFVDLYAQGTSIEALTNAGEDTRITIVDSSGKVLADSWPLDMEVLENHLARPEIQAAAAQLPQVQLRYSDTLGGDMVYYALKTAADSDGNSVFVRAAMPVERIDAYLWQSLPLMVLLLAVIALLGVLFARATIGQVTHCVGHIESKIRSLASGNYESQDRPNVPKSFEEIDRITARIDDVAELLQSNITELSEQKAKLSYILDNIADGLFVINEHKNIELINATALKIFNAEEVVREQHLNYLTYNQNIAAAVDKCLSDQTPAAFELILDDSVYMVTVRRLPQTELVMVALTNITESHKSAKRREEFFANASHELKTPLTAIRGFNELNSINNKNAATQKYIDGIARETERMMLLIDDMLGLANLESTDITSPITIELADVAKDVCETLLTEIEEKSLRLTCKGSAKIKAEPKHIYELVKNLVENAVRYTESGGKVNIQITDSPGTATLIVADNGIGITPGDQSRIFERFYRVEKSRSQQGGGTGLGLAIIKHICLLYDWDLDLKSRVGKGTTVTVDFR